MHWMMKKVRSTGLGGLELRFDGAAILPGHDRHLHRKFGARRNRRELEHVAIHFRRAFANVIIDRNTRADMAFNSSNFVPAF